MTPTEKRARIDTLLAEAHLAGMMTSNADRTKFTRAWIEILSLVRDGADLSLAPPAETLQPLPTKLNVTPATLPEARAKLSELQRRLDRLRVKPRLERSVIDDDELAALPGEAREFREQYARARCRLTFEEILEIADNAQGDVPARR
jgi:hypothetical protein